MNMRSFAEELICMCDELDYLRGKVQKLETENDAYRKDQIDTFLHGQQTAANWLEFVMDKRVTLNDNPC